MSDISAGESSPKKSELTGEALLLAIRKQVEFYFSPSNLSMDKFLVSQMDPQMFVPLQVIASFKKVQVLTKVTARFSANACFMLSDVVSFPTSVFIVTHIRIRTLRKSWLP
jgi:hypothetical protein